MVCSGRSEQQRDESGDSVGEGVRGSDPTGDEYQAEGSKVILNKEQSRVYDMPSIEPPRSRMDWRQSGDTEAGYCHDLGEQ